MPVHVFADLENHTSPALLQFDARGHLFVVCDLTSEVIELDPAGEVVWRHDLKAGSIFGIGAMLVAVDGTIWLAGTELQRLQHIDPITGRTELFPLADGSNPAALAEFGGDVYSADTGADTISRVASGDRAASVFAHLRPGSGPVDLAIDSDGWVYVANWRSRSVSVVDPGGCLRADIKAGNPAPHLSSLSAVIGDALFISTGAAVLRLDLETRVLQESCTLPPGSFVGFDIVTAGSQLYLPGGTSEVVRIDTGSRARTHAQTLAFGSDIVIHGAAVDQAGRLYVADYRSGRILVWEN